MLMLCLTWWTFEIGGLLAGVISEVELGAQSVVYQIYNIAYSVILIQFTFYVIRTENRSVFVHSYNK